jgi:signal transduction histidine kinase
MRISIRYQLLGLVSLTLTLSMAVYVWLANDLFTRDKMATIYDLNTSLVGTVSEEVRSAVGTLVEKLLYFAGEQAAVPESGDRDGPARSLFSADTDVLSLEVWDRNAQGLWKRSYRFINPERLGAANLSEDDLAESRRTRPVPFDAVVAQKTMLQNASLAPDIAILSLAAVCPGGGRVVIADLRPDRLLRIFGRSLLYRVYLVDGRGGIVVHPDAQKVVSRANVAALPVVRDAIEGSLARGARQFSGDGGELIGAFARVGEGRMVVIAEVPREQALRASRELVRKSVLFGVGMVFFPLLLSISFSRWITAPLRRLEEATRRVASGDLTYQVEVRSHNEIGSLAEAFNRMGQELADREASLAESNTQLIQSEKLSVLGELSASVIHELKNPMVGILGFAQLGASSKSVDEMKEYLKLIENHTRRSNEILQNLLKFVRQEKAHFEPLSSSMMIKDAMRLVGHQLQMKRVQLELAFGEGVPLIMGNANQLQQVLINLVMNAQQAMEASPKKMLAISTSAEEGRVVIALRDTGCGMSKEVQEKLFTPFFTTKPRGKGTGLGLSVSRRIVSDHGGEIGVESEEGKGTTFFIRIPSLPKRGEASQPAA